MNQDNHKELESILSQSITISKEIPYPNSLQLKDQWFDVGGEKFYYSLGEMKPLLEAYIALREREASKVEWQRIYDHFENLDPKSKMPDVNNPRRSVLLELNELKKGEE